MKGAGFALFDTAVGRCGVAWGDDGLIRCLQLPEATPQHTRRRLAGRFPDGPESAPPPEVTRVMAAIVALTAGERVDLSPVPLDLAGVADFDRRVYEVARTIPPGTTLTYGDVATRLGSPLLARAVGQALGRNPCAILVPCHRVVAAGGKPGGFSATGGVPVKLRLLSIERGDRHLPGFPPPVLKRPRR